MASQLIYIENLQKGDLKFGGGPDKRLIPQTLNLDILVQKEISYKTMYFEVLTPTRSPAPRAAKQIRGTSKYIISLPVKWTGLIGKMHERLGETGRQ